MDATSKVSPKQLMESLRPEVEAFLESVMQAVNEAPDGEWIAGSEEDVRNLAAEFRERVFQEAVQQRIDAAEAAFPPLQETLIDPITKQPVTKRLANKGRQSTHVLTVNGRIALKRRRRRPDHPKREWPMESLLANPRQHKNLTSPGLFARPDSRKLESDVVNL